MYLTDKLSHRPRERMHHLQCLVYVRPCPASIHALCQELLSPKYGAYWLYFSNVVAKHDIEALAEAGARAVIQPGGSMRDAEVIAAADEHGIAMVFTGVRHFRH